MLMPKNLSELIESLESLASFSRCNSALAHLPVDELLENILEGDFEKALGSLSILIEPLRDKDLSRTRKVGQVASPN